MKILHTIHAVGEYSEMQQQVHIVEHSDLLLAYHDINHFEEEDRRMGLDPFTTQTEHGIFTSCPSVTESYVIIG
ncbi:hypothetical protein D3C75_503380 [compost metagenome]